MSNIFNDYSNNYLKFIKKLSSPNPKNRRKKIIGIISLEIEHNIRIKLKIRNHLENIQSK